MTDPLRRSEPAQAAAFLPQSFGHSTPRRSIPMLGIGAVLLLLVALGFLLREKFAADDKRWLHWDHLAVKSLVLGQNPDRQDPPAAAVAFKEPRIAQDTPAWAAAEEGKSISHTVAKPKASPGHIQLAGHFTDDPRHGESPEVPRESAFSPPGQSESPPATHGKDLTAVETPRTLFDGPDEARSPAGTVHPRPLPPARKPAPAQSEPDPFAQARPIQDDPFASAAAPAHREEFRHAATEDVAHPGVARTSTPHHASLPEQLPESRTQEDALRFQHTASGRSSSVPPMNIQQVAAIEPEPHQAAPEPEPFELKPTPATHHPQHAPQQVPARPMDIPALPAEIPTLDAVPAHTPQARPLMPLDRAAAAPTPHVAHPAEREPSHFFPAEPAPARTLAKPDYMEPSVQAVSSQTAALKTTHSPAAKEEIHQVQPGDNYWTISRKYYGSARFFAALGEYNKHRIPQPEKMKPGMYVLVPEMEVLHQRYPQLTGGGAEAEPAPAGFFVDASGQPCYRVGKGDTLTEISQQYLGRSSRWVQVYGMNKDRIPDVNSLKIGAVLRLPADATQVVLAPGGAELR